MPLKPLTADHMMWALTWDEDAYSDAAGKPCVNRRTGELVWCFDLDALHPVGPFDQNAEILSWPETNREVVPLLLDEQAAVAWLAERGFAVEWTLK